eukprot:Clim_evm81s147 gene=Clim_evmTU81s147
MIIRLLLAAVAMAAQISGKGKEFVDETYEEEKGVTFPLSRSGIHTELNFELPDREAICFEEYVKEDETLHLEYQVFLGGNLDVDVQLTSPGGKVMYQARKQKFAEKEVTAPETGFYSICFSNEMSSVTHKRIYINVGAGDYMRRLPEEAGKNTVLDKLGSMAESIRSHINSIIDDQTHHRLGEAKGFERAKYLNSAISWWSGLQAIVMLLISFTQVYFIRGMFVLSSEAEMRKGKHRYHGLGKVDI